VVTLFPEGTSSNGRSVLPFRSSLLEPVFRNGHQVTPAALDYQLANGSVEEEVCYWGDMTLGPHLLNLLSKEGIQANVRFGRPGVRSFADRKELARNLHESVCGLRAMGPTRTVGAARPIAFGQEVGTTASTTTKIS